MCVCVCVLLQTSGSADGLSLYDLVTSSATSSQLDVIAIELQKTSTGALGFMLGVDALDRPMVKHVEPCASVKKGDR